MVQSRAEKSKSLCELIWKVLQVSGQLFNAVFNSECKKAEANTRQFSIDEDQVGTISIATIANQNQLLSAWSSSSTIILLHIQMSNNYQRHNLHHHHCKHCKDHRHQMALHQRFFITQEIFTTHMIMITIIFITMMMMKMIMIMKMNMMKMSLMMMMMMNDMKMITAMIFISFCLQLCSSRKKVIFPQKALNSQNKWMWEFHCHHCHHHHKNTNGPS